MAILSLAVVCYFLMLGILKILLFVSPRAGQVRKVVSSGKLVIIAMFIRSVGTTRPEQTM